MDMLNEFKRARPEPEAFTEADAGLLWARTFDALDTNAAGPAERDESPLIDGFEPAPTALNVVSWDRPSRAGRRRFAGLMAAAAVVAMVLGVAVIQSRQSSPPDTAAGPTSAIDPATAPPSWNEFPHPPIDPRFQYATTATDSGIFVWGGCCADSSGSTFFTDGAYYDATIAEWRELPAAPLDLTRGDAIAAWNGSEVLAINGVDGATAAAFDPASFTWRSVTPPISATITNGGSQLQPLEDGRVALADDMAVTIWDPIDGAWTDRVELDGIDRGETSEAWNSRYASTPTTLAVVTSDSDTEAGTDCSTARVRSFDFASSTWSTFGFETTDWLPTAVIGLDTTRFLLAGGFPCDGQPAQAPRAAIVDTATETVSWVASPPTQVDGRRYGPTLAGGAAAFLGTDGRLAVYRPDTDQWSVGTSVLSVGEPNGDMVNDTPLVWLDGRIVIVSTGYGQSNESGGWTCCFPTAAAWQTALPTGIDPTLQPPPVADANPSTTAPTATPEPAATANEVLFANASETGGIAGRYASLLRTAQQYNVVDVANATSNADTTVVYALPGSEPLATSVIDHLELTGIEPQPIPSAPPIEPGRDLTNVAVIVVIGTDLDEPQLPDTADLSVAIVHPPGQKAEADALAEQLEQHGIAVDASAESTRTFEQTMLMPLGDSHASSYVLSDLLGIGGFDTWTPELAQTELPDTITDVIHLSNTDAIDIRSRISSASES